MKEECAHCTPAVCPPASETHQAVQIDVDLTHPLLQLKRSLPWDELTEIMTRHWRQAGRNTDGRPGLQWDVSLYVPLVVLMLVKNLHCRHMEAYLSENVVARLFIGRHDDPSPQVRDHSNIDRAYRSLGKAGLEEVNALLLRAARDCGYADPSILSSDMTAQELPIGYPNEPGILRGLAQRCGRALNKLKTRLGLWGVDAALDQVQTVLLTVKEHHLFTKGREEKRQVLTRLLTEVGQLLVQTRLLLGRVGESGDRMVQGAVATLSSMHEVAKVLVPQIVHWMTTGVVAKGKILHAGITQARSIVRNKAGKKVEFGLPYLLSRIGGGYIFGRFVGGVVNESKMPLEALSDYRSIFGMEETPTLVVYDRAGNSQTTVKKLRKEGVEQIGIQPKGRGEWQVVGEVRDQVRSERGKTEGIIGTLKSGKYKFNKPKERLWQSLEMLGPRSILSFNLNKLMRDVVEG